MATEMITHVSDPGVRAPIGIIGGYLVLRTRSVWAPVALHTLVMISMIADIFVLPGLARG